MVGTPLNLKGLSLAVAVAQGAATPPSRLREYLARRETGDGLKDAREGVSFFF